MPGTSADSRARHRKDMAVHRRRRLVAAGLFGSVDNPIVAGAAGALFQVDTLHSVVHLVSGLVALFMGTSQHGRALGEATIAFGGMYS